MALLSNDKKKNIKEVYHRLKESYQDGKSVEMALVFVKKESYGTVDILYDTRDNSCIYVESTHSSPYTVDISGAVNNLIDTFGDSCIITAIHNHRNATSFGYIDICTFITYDCMVEFFLDSSDYIFFAIKQNPIKRLSQDDIDRIKKSLYDLYEKIVQSYKNAVDKAIKTVADPYERNNIIDDIISEINEKFWESAKEERLIYVTSSKIRKSILELY